MENKHNFECVKNWFSENFVGILAVVAGFILVGITYKILLNLIIFSLGLILIYVGLLKLRIKPITDFVDKTGAKLKKFLQ